MQMETRNVKAVSAVKNRNKVGEVYVRSFFRGSLCCSLHKKCAHLVEGHSDRLYFRAKLLCAESEQCDVFCFSSCRFTTRNVYF